MKKLLAVVFIITLLLPGCVKLGVGAAADKLPRVHVFQAAPETVELGQQVMLSWEVSDASSVTIEPGVGAVETTGSKLVTVTAPTTFTLTANNRHGKTEKTVSIAAGQSGGVAVEQPPVQALPPSDNKSAGGQSGGADVEQPPVQALPPSDDQSGAAPSATLAPSLMQPSGGTQTLGSLQSIVPADAAKGSGAGGLQGTFYALPNPALPGQSVRLYWTTANASRVDLLDDYNEYVKRNIALSGTLDIVPSGTIIYKLRVTGASDSLDLRYTINVE